MESSICRMGGLYAPAEHVCHHFHLGFDGGDLFGGAGLWSPTAKEERHD